MKETTVYITCGPSGSGKSTFYERFKKDLPDALLICPDDIRKELTGDVSDQSKNKEVWTLAYERLTKAIKNGREVYFCATFCQESGLRTIISHINEAVKENNITCKVEIMLFPLTSTFALKHRVARDLRHKKDRSNTLKVIEKNGEKRSVIGHQNKAYKQLYRFLMPLRGCVYGNKIVEAYFEASDNVRIYISDICKECLK